MPSFNEEKIGLMSPLKQQQQHEQHYGKEEELFL